MVLCRTPKQYKHLIRILLTQLVEHERILTSRAKARHLKRKGEKLLRIAKKAEAGHSGPRNILQSLVHTKKAQQKLLIDIAPRIKEFTGGCIHVSKILHRRKGDNTPLVRVQIKSNDMNLQKRNMLEELSRRGELKDTKLFNAKTLLQEKEFYLEEMQKKPEMEDFFKRKIQRIEYENWLITKNKKEPPKYTLIV